MAKFSEYESVGREYNIGGQDWYKFKAGENRVRLVTEFQEYATHFIKEGDRKENVTCEGDLCEHCQKGESKRRVQFIGWILDRADGQLKLASIGWSVFKQIGEYATSSEFGFSSDIPPYDIIVKKTGEGLGTEYTVMPSRNEAPLTEEEGKKLSEVNDPADIVAKMKEKHPGSRLSAPVKKAVEDDGIPVINTDDDVPLDEKDLPF